MKFNRCESVKRNALFIFFSRVSHLKNLIVLGLNMPKNVIMRVNYRNMKNHK